MVACHTTWRKTVQSLAQEGKGPWRLRIWGRFLLDERLLREKGGGSQAEKTAGWGRQPGKSHKKKREGLSEDTGKKHLWAAELGRVFLVLGC